ncbi:MAG: 2-succinyl-5-enolpyruvyl-6-hydroxy-3-cyclohexene-1-carboxylic-acid synthase [Solibacillus sp.]
MSNVLTSYVYKMISALMQGGVVDVVISPGSRSTPLAYGFASTEGLNVYRQVDERSAGFFALGLAKATAKPVVLLCTSGTAAANYYPAVVEAKYARVPLIVITADRPHELREVGAPQAINQMGLYGEHVKWSAEFPIPDDAPATLPFIERHSVRAVAIATSAPFGPVHVNVPFREPLLIDFGNVPPATFKKSYVSELEPSRVAKKELQEIIAATRAGIIVVGELPLGTDTTHLWNFVRAVQWPVLIESLSNLRTEVPEDCQLFGISTYDALLKSERFKRNVTPETVIRFGAQPVSKFLMQHIAASKPKNYVVVDEDVMFRDSVHASTHFIHARVGEWLSELEVDNARTEISFAQFWKMADLLAVDTIEKYKTYATDEGAMVRTFIERLPAGSDVFVSSSMPIRDIDTFLTTEVRDVQVFANRGANGIDGVMSTALGFSKGRPERKAYILIGDLAFLHDVNAFIATRYQECDATIVVMNNDGGGIFSYLPQASVTAHYEDLFGTPTGLTFEQVASMYGFDYKRATTVAEFEEAMRAGKTTPIQLIEAFTNREQNVTEHRQLWQNIKEGLDAWLDSL